MIRPEITGVTAVISWLNRDWPSEGLEREGFSLLYLVSPSTDRMLFLTSSLHRKSTKAEAMGVLKPRFCVHTAPHTIVSWSKQIRRPDQRKGWKYVLYILVEKNNKAI